jgi:hypothetical protein
MKIAPLILAATAFTALAPAAASANPYHHPGYRGHIYAAPFYYPRFFSPYSFYVAPFVAAPYYAYPPVYRPPVVIERRYAEAAPRLQPAEPQYREGERSYAQATPPPQAQPRTPAQPAPRLERYTL